MWRPKNFFFSNYQYKAEFKNLDDSEVFSSDFSSLRNLCSHIDLIGLCNLSGLNSLYSHISSKNFLILMVQSSLAPKWPIWIPLCGMDHEKSTFLLISEALSLRGCWGQPVLLFWKLVDKTQMSKPPEATRHHKSRKLLILLPHRAI